MVKKLVAKTQHETLGFTLIEILVSMALLSILAGIGVSMFGIVNNSYNRANRINTIRTQGSQALEQLERSIRGATSASTDCTNGTTNCSLVLVFPTDSIDYISNGAGCTQITYAWIKPDFSAKTNGQLTSQYGNCTPGPAPSLASLFDADNQVGVSVEAASSATPIFTINNPASGNSTPTITTKFTLWEGVKNSSATPTNRANVPYTSTTSLRNY
jgi:prepilin-type N-terminal cleavage/methylation domain-containing protein